jgi:DNA-binding NtrC family response regulator
MGMKTVLVVDDEPDICSELSLFLTHKGFQVVTAPNGKEALAIYKKIKPDIVISDYKMPVMNGFDLLLNIKRANKAAAVVLMSAVVDLDPFIMTRNSAAYEFIHKPVDLNELLTLVQKKTSD